MYGFITQKKFQIIKERADAGDAESQATIGWFFENGERVQQSFEQAFHYYNKSAEQNFMRGLFHLAGCFADGRGTQKSAEKAIHYYNLAADQGYVLAQAELGHYLLKVKIDEGKAVEYLKIVAENKSYDKGLSALCEYDLGDCFENGIGVQASHSNALYYYKRAAEHGDQTAQEKLGDIYLKGELGVEKSPKQAVYYYKLTANQGSSSSLRMLGECCEKGLGLEKSATQAFQYYKLAADIDMKNGKGSSIFALARCYKLGIGTEKSLEKAIYYYKVSAENGFSPGYHELTDCYRELGGEENKQKTDAYSKMARSEEAVKCEEKFARMKKMHDFNSVNKKGKKLNKACERDDFQFTA